jgi:hypothetical protein
MLEITPHSGTLDGFSSRFFLARLHLLQAQVAFILVCFLLSVIRRLTPVVNQKLVIMHTSHSLLVSVFAIQASAHGVVTMIRGANGVDMPGLSG